jgi:hypothetical protein
LRERKAISRALITAAAFTEDVRVDHRCPKFTINAIVPLPDHLHAIWSLPPGDEFVGRPSQAAVLPEGFSSTAWAEASYGIPRKCCPSMSSATLRDR